MGADCCTSRKSEQEKIKDIEKDDKKKLTKSESLNYSMTEYSAFSER